MKEHYELGSVVKAHGIKGDLVIYINTDIPFRKKLPASLYIGSGESIYEFPLLSARVNGKMATVHLKGIEDRTTAENYIKKTVFISMSDLPKRKPKEFLPNEITGYSVHDKTSGELGKVKQVYDLPQHLVLEIEYHGKAALLPATDAFLLKINHEKKIIYMDLPDGLLDVYLE